MQTSCVQSESPLRRTLLGEYLGTALILHAGLGALVGAVTASHTPAGLLFVATGCWIIGRAAGAFAQRLFPPLVSLGLLVAVLMLRLLGLLPASTLGNTVLWPAFVVMLLAVLTLDVIGLATSRRGALLLKRLRRWNWSRLAIGGGVAMLASYLVLVPAVDLLLEQFRPVKSVEVLEELTFAEQVRVRSTEALVALVFFSFGAAVGSFLNVVVYRAPRGESVAFQRSHCPTCGSQIHGRDNVPILGWLLLKGRCRACQAPISVRYPAIETVAASLFLLLYFVELISGGVNIPVRRPNHYAGVVWIILYTKWDLVGLYLFHCFTLCLLLTWALIDWDRRRIPAWLHGLAAVALAALPAIWPDLLPVPWWHAGELTPLLPEWLAASPVGTSLLGGLVGALLGWFASKAFSATSSDTAVPDKSAGPPGGHLISAGLLVGLSLGWQAAVGVWLLVLLLRPIVAWAVRPGGASEPPATPLVLTACLTQLIGWRLTSAGWWPSANTSPPAWAILGVALVALWALNRAVSPRVTSSV